MSGKSNKHSYRMLREKCLPFAICYIPNTIVEEPEQFPSLKRDMHRQSTHSILTLHFLDFGVCKLCKSVFLYKIHFPQNIISTFFPSV